MEINSNHQENDQYQESLKNLIKASKNPKVIATQNILEEKLNTKLLSEIEIVNEEFFNKMKKDIENLDIYLQSSNELKNGFVTDDYSSIVLHLSQQISKKELKLPKHPDFVDNTNGRCYFGNIFFGEEELFKLEIKCKNKDEFKKSASFHILKKLYPTALVILSINILNENKNFVKNWENEKIENISVVENKIEIDENDQILFAKLPLNSKILKLKIMFNSETNNQKKILENEKKIFEIQEANLISENYSMAASAGEQKIKGKSLKLNATMIDGGIYKVTGISGNPTELNQGILFETDIKCQNKNFAKRVGGLIYFKVCYPLVYKWILAQKLDKKDLIQEAEELLKQDNFSKKIGQSLVVLEKDDEPELLGNVTSSQVRMDKRKNVTHVQGSLFF